METGKGIFFLKLTWKGFWYHLIQHLSFSAYKSRHVSLEIISSILLLWQVRVRRRADDDNGKIVCDTRDDGNVVTVSLNSIKASKCEEELSLELTLGLKP